MSKTKIISFHPVTRELRAAIKAEGFNDPVTNKTDMWAEVLAEVAAMSQADDPRAILELEANLDGLNNQLTSGVFADNAPPHVFILPRGGGDVGLLRGAVLTDLDAWADDRIQHPASASAYVWSPGHTKLAKVFPFPVED